MSERMGSFLCGKINGLVQALYLNFG